MTDSLSPYDRSENMRKIKGKNTLPEIVVRKIVHGLGFRYRLHVKTLPGKPDLLFPRLKKIIDVRGCFWHQHPGCIDSHIPASRDQYWRPKLENNVRRDLENLDKLRSQGWDVLVVWECETKASRKDALVERLLQFLAESSTASAGR